MSLARRAVWPEARGLPHLGWWALLALALALLLTLGGIPAAAALALLIVQRARPFDFLTSCLIVVMWGSVIDYTTGQLTLEMSLLSIALVYMVFCYVLWQRADLLSFPSTPITRPMLLYQGLTLINFARGLMAGNSARYAGLELIAAWAIGCCLLVCNLRMQRAAIATALAWLCATGFVHAGLGLHSYAAFHGRRGDNSFEPVSGMVAALLLNFALRESRPRRVVLWLALMLPCVLHQLLSFTRGDWIALISSTLFSVLVFSARGPGSGERWRRSALVVAGLGGLVAASGAIGALTFNISELWQTVGTRFASSTGTEYSYATQSNVWRLVELANALRHIHESPWFGKGLGYTILFTEPIFWSLHSEWFIHENYLLVWLKQGLVGLALFVWLLIAAVRTGLKGRNLPDRWQASWCAGTAAVTFHLMIYSLVHFPLAEVNSCFALALMWGGAMAMTARETTVIRWRRQAPSS